MDVDDPTKPEFASWQSFRHFAHRVRHQRRFVLDVAVKAFLATVLATRSGRDVVLPKGMVLFRAQRGIDYLPIPDTDEVGEEPVGYGKERMKPQPNRAKEGRANPSGVPVLYLGTSEQSVISEVRPWVGSEVSVAQFKILRPLKTIDLSQDFGKTSLSVVTIQDLVEDGPIDAERKKKAVWIDIDNAFSEPLTLSDDAADYVPTQILAELFRDAGYDAVVYKSQFGEKGFNVVVFNPDDAEVINCAPYRVTGIDISFKEIGNRWYSTKNLKSK